jgi:hypothetical protein
MSLSVNVDDENMKQDDDCDADDDTGSNHHETEHKKLLPLSIEHGMKDDGICRTSIEMAKVTAAAAEASISIRKLAWTVLVLLLSSHVVLLHQCRMVTTEEDTTAKVRGRYRASTNITIMERPTRHPDRYGDSENFCRDVLQHGDVVETIEEYVDGNVDGNVTPFLIAQEYDDFVRVVHPTAGFLSRETLSRLEPVQFFHQESTLFGGTPLIYQGWWPSEDHSERQYVYAPTALVVAQSLWNAMQVFQLFLLLTLGCEGCHAADVNGSSCTLQKFLVAFLVMACLTLLPFSVYVISLGGHIFACLTVMTTLVALSMPYCADLYFSVQEGPKKSNPNETSARTWRIIDEETVACLANAFSHMYNGRQPWWSTFDFVDRLFGFKNGGDVTPKIAFSMGRSGTRIPLFVSQANHSSTGARVFLVLWSILPFWYVSYFLIMYVTAVHSPGVKVQRAVCLFGIVNFLFCTDVVAYRYGRGYRSPYEDIFHWWEHFAWRAAIVLPLYQNCTNGHWEHPRYPVLGKILRVAAASYGIFFLVFQIILGDVVQFVTFLTRGEEWTFFELMGWEDSSIITGMNLNTPRTWATMIMSILYFCLHFSGFPLFQVSMGRQSRDVYGLLPAN